MLPVWGSCPENGKWLVWSRRGDQCEELPGGLDFTVSRVSHAPFPHERAIFTGGFGPRHWCFLSATKQREQRCGQAVLCDALSCSFHIFQNLCCLGVSL